MNAVKKKWLEVAAQTHRAFLHTYVWDTAYRLRMKKRCPHPEHRISRFNDHGKTFDYCSDCRNVV